MKFYVTAGGVCCCGGAGAVGDYYTFMWCFKPKTNHIGWNEQSKAKHTNKLKIKLQSRLSGQLCVAMHR